MFLVDKWSLVNASSLVDARSPLLTSSIAASRLQVPVSLSLVNPLSREVQELYAEWFLALARRSLGVSRKEESLMRRSSLETRSSLARRRSLSCKEEYLARRSLLR